MHEPGETGMQQKGNDRDDECMIRVKSIFADASDNDGWRVFIDPVWPYKVSRTATVLDLWLRCLAPSPELYSQFAGGRMTWEDFLILYHGELAPKHGSLRDLHAYHHDGGLTLLHGSPSEDRNAAVAVKLFLEQGDHAADGGRVSEGWKGFARPDKKGTPVRSLSPP